MDYLLHPRFTILTLLLSSYHAYLLDLYILSVMQILVVNAGFIYHNQFHKELIPNFRYIDIMIALCGMYYNAIYYSYYCYDSNMCVYFFTMAILFYLLGLYFNSNRLHCGIHIFSVIGNLALQECIYAGNKIV